MAEQGQFRRVITNLTHGGHAILDTADNAETTAKTEESLSMRSTVVQESTGVAAHVGTTAFDYLFPDLAEEFPDRHLPDDDVSKVVAALLALGSAMVETADEVAAPQFNSPIPPVYTYWGQFTDHDLTAATDRDLVISITDPNLRPVRPQDVVEKLENLRIPALNLDSVYGDGPFAAPVAGKDAVPYDGVKFRLGLLSPVPVTVGALIPRSPTPNGTCRARPTAPRSSATPATTRTSWWPNCTWRSCGSTTRRSTGCATTSPSSSRTPRSSAGPGTSPGGPTSGCACTTICAPWPAPMSSTSWTPRRGTCSTWTGAAPTCRSSSRWRPSASVTAWCAAATTGTATSAARATGPPPPA